MNTQSLMKKAILLSGLLIVLVGLSVYTVYLNNQQVDEQKTVDVTPKPIPETIPTPETPETPVKESIATVMFTGDFFYRNIVMQKAYDPTIQKMNFDAQLEPVKHLLSKADITVSNLLGTVSPIHPVVGDALYNANPLVIQAMKNSGIDSINLATDHQLDSQIRGLKLSKDAIESQGLSVLGLNETQPHIHDINGIKIAMLAYSDSYSNMDSYLKQEDVVKTVTSLKQEEVIKQHIKQIRNEVDVVIVLAYKGTRYTTTPDPKTKELYHRLLSYGADVVVGNGPRVVQQNEIVIINGQKKVILYSLGNFLSNERHETMPGKSFEGEHGVIIELEFRKKGQEVTINSLQAHPTWVYRGLLDNRTQFKVLDATKYFEIDGYQDRIDASVDAIFSRIQEIHP